jgi:hypothetical protein
VREATNLSWPDQPFGAGQRPFAAESLMLAAVSVDLANIAGRRLPVCGSTTYLRVERTRNLQIVPRTLRFGFRSLVISHDAETIDLAHALDGDLIRCRRHAAILAGHDLADTLTVLPEAAGRELPGVTTVLDAWIDRDRRQRGTATMLDTRHDAGTDDASVEKLGEICQLAASKPSGTDTVALHRACLAGDTCAAESLLFACTTQSLTIALAAARLLGKYHWRHPIDLDDLVADVAWDCFPHLTATRQPLSKRSEPT